MGQVEGGGGAQRPSIAETLLEFAEPLLDFEDPDFGKRELWEPGSGVLNQTGVDSFLVSPIGS